MFFYENINELCVCGCNCDDQCYINACDNHCVNCDN